MYCPIILGSDKTIVSVGTGHVEYHPLYISISNPHNTVRCAHRNAVILIAFLAIPKCMWSSYVQHNLSRHLTMRSTTGDCNYDETPEFRSFKCQLYHASIAAVLCLLLPGMSAPIICRCPDGHFQWVIYDLVAFIADYPEQVLLTGIVQGWCPRWAQLFSLIIILTISIEMHHVPKKPWHIHTPLDTWPYGQGVSPLQSQRSMVWVWDHWWYYCKFFLLYNLIP
jgi:hypothetical protein